MMHATRVITLLFLISLVFACEATAQETSPIKPMMPPHYLLSRVAVAKITADGKLSVLFPQVKTEMRTRTVPVTKMRTEQRVRTRNVERDGKTQTITETYTVNVPYTETITQQHPVSVAKTAAKLKLDSFQGWDIDGKMIPKDELAKRLAKPTSVFFVEGGPGNNTFPDFYKPIINPETVFISRGKAKRNNVEGNAVQNNNILPQQDNGIEAPGELEDLFDDL